jgi:hypothetical protein
VNGKTTSVKADEAAAKYLYTATVTDIPATGRVTVRITPMAVSADGSKTYTGTTKTLAVTNGKVTHESMTLNGVLLENFAIIHCKNDDFAQVPQDAVIRSHSNSFSTQALVRKDKLVGEFVMDKPSIEDIMLYYTKEVQ